MRMHSFHQVSHTRRKQDMEEIYEGDRYCEKN